ncbi:MAG: PEP-CTERM sorting domain-containing protein [Opitutus sp.]|nr:PEP-CTERM sorting domain-containing protein [Opitutus sp.]MCS6247824.1 PEP-CTERM sorting domain-containing protein [Opitutus sp.]MCS6274327.1 PEP-CTERM sorting domain-containing protein [Opitutus sp.]MCS6301821.1 PEP-CTERM sorting domain-containing protein [Opitutus sp.]
MSSASTFNGTVSAVPEPATYTAFFGLSVLGLAVYRRRRTVA